MTLMYVSGGADIYLHKTNSVPINKGNVYSP